MKIGIIGALDIEVKSIIATMQKETVKKISGMDFYIGSLSGVSIVVVHCGVGKVNAAICTQSMIMAFQPDVVINMGVAGGMGPDVRIGDLVIAQSLVQHDFSGLDLPKGQVDGLDVLLIPCSQWLIDSFCEVSAELDLKAYLGIIATGDQFIADSEVSSELYAH